MACIFINVPGHVALINFVHLGTLKYIDKTPSLLKRHQEVLLELQHGIVTSISDTNRMSIGIKFILVIMASIVVHTSHIGDVQIVSGGTKSGIIIYTR